MVNLDSIVVSDERAMRAFQANEFIRTRAWVPDGPFQKYFPLGAQVARAESTVAYAYTHRSFFAYRANDLFRKGD